MEEELLVTRVGVGSRVQGAGFTEGRGWEGMED